MREQPTASCHRAVAQAHLEGLTLVTHDGAFHAYDVPIESV